MPYAQKLPFGKPGFSEAMKNKWITFDKASGKLMRQARTAMHGTPVWLHDKPPPLPLGPLAWRWPRVDVGGVDVLPGQHDR